MGDSSLAETLVSMAAIAGMVVSGIMVVYLRDMVYASGMLALLGLSTAILIAVLGYPIIAAFMVVVYVGAAVMFIIISVSMLGGGGAEWRDHERGLVVAGFTLAALMIALFYSGLQRAYLEPPGVDLQTVAALLVDRYGVPLAVILAALAATLLEAIAVARRR